MGLDLQGQTRPYTVLGADVWDVSAGTGARAFVVREGVPGGWSRGRGGTYEYTTGTVQPGGSYFVHIQYDPSPSPAYVPVLIRGSATNGNMFNTGTLVVSSDPAARTSEAYTPQNRPLYYMEVRASGGVSIWRAILGVVLWLVPGGQVATVLLLNRDGGTAQTTFMLPRGTYTLYYRYTGCTAFLDYGPAAFTVDTSQVPAGHGLVLNAEGWCDGGGVGNAARISQAAPVPAAFHNLGSPSGDATHLTITFNHPFAPSSNLVLSFTATYRVYGPDDCSGYYADLYRTSTGINYIVSGACGAPYVWGRPGGNNRTYTSFPAVELRRYLGSTIYIGGIISSTNLSASVSNGSVSLFLPGGLFPGLTANNLTPSLYTQFYTPTPYIPGYVTSRTVTYTNPDGTTGSRNPLTGL